MAVVKHRRYALPTGISTIRLKLFFKKKKLHKFVFKKPKIQQICFFFKNHLALLGWNKFFFKKDRHLLGYSYLFFGKSGVRVLLTGVLDSPRHQSLTAYFFFKKIR